MATANLTAQRLRELLNYDPDTGLFTWRIQRSNVAKGAVAGNLRPDGYFDIRIDGKIHRAHRLAWLYMTGAWPDNLIDHIDRNPSNTRWGNLRQATHSQNHQNQKIRADSRHGHRGLSPHSSGLWRARIRVRGRVIHLGYFPTVESASQARADAERKYFTHSPLCAPQAESLDPPCRQDERPSAFPQS